jgi:hypothetical protein
MNHAQDGDLVAHDLVRDREQETRDDVAARSDTSAGSLRPTPEASRRSTTRRARWPGEVITCAGTVVVVPARCRFVLGKRLGKVPNAHLRDERRARSASRTWAWAAAGSTSCAVPFSIDADRRSISAPHAAVASSFSSDRRYAAVRRRSGCALVPEGLEPRRVSSARRVARPAHRSLRAAPCRDPRRLCRARARKARHHHMSTRGRNLYAELLVCKTTDRNMTILF